MADIFDAIADSTRRDILHILLERGGAGEITAADLAEQLGVTVPTVTRHLGVLRERSLVSSRDEGRIRYFHLELTPFEELREWLAPFAELSFVGDDLAGDPRVAGGDDSAVFSAWAGTDVGSTIGRAVAERSYQARNVIQNASEKVTQVTERVTQALPENLTRRWQNKDGADKA